MAKHNVETAFKNMLRMDAYVRKHVNNEDLIYDRWFLFVPDGGDGGLQEDDAEDIAGDLQAYIGVCEIFSSIVVDDKEED